MHGETERLGTAGCFLKMSEPLFGAILCTKVRSFSWDSAPLCWLLSLNGMAMKPSERVLSWLFFSKPSQTTLQQHPPSQKVCKSIPNMLSVGGSGFSGTRTPSWWPRGGSGASALRASRRAMAAGAPTGTGARAQKRTGGTSVWACIFEGTLFWAGSKRAKGFPYVDTFVSLTHIR